MINPLILVGGLSKQRREWVFEWLEKQKCPIYIEGTSGLRGALPHLELKAAEKTAKLTEFDSIIRVGQVPTLRVWRDLEKATTPVLSISDLPFTGLGRSDTRVIPFSEEVMETTYTHGRLSEILDHDREEFERLEILFKEFPQSEPALIHEISQQISAEDSVYLGNSLPIREWDLAARRDVCFPRCFGNRGANGIDGQISTFLGWADEKARNWAILGDLTTMYDLSAPWALRARPIEDLRIVVINNGGGKIFAPMFRQPLFENRHDTNFAAWASMWKLPYMTWNGGGTLARGVIEVTPDWKQSEMFRSLW